MEFKKLKESAAERIGCFENACPQFDPAANPGRQQAGCENRQVCSSPGMVCRGGYKEVEW